MGFSWWSNRDSNPGPPPCKGRTGYYGRSYGTLASRTTDGSWWSAVTGSATLGRYLGTYTGLSYYPLLVGICGLEPQTSSLSVTRSNQLSYIPIPSILPQLNTKIKTTSATASNNRSRSAEQSRRTPNYNRINEWPLQFLRTGIYRRSYGYLRGRTTDGYWWSGTANPQEQPNRRNHRG